MNTNVINTLIENPRLLVIFFAESLPSVALAYWLVWLVMRPKSNSGIHTPFSWHLYGIAISLLGFTIFHIIAMATFVGSDAYTGDKALSYPLIASAIIAGLYIRWLKQEMLKKHTNADWKETKPQDTSEKTEFIPPSRIYETEKTESIPSSYIYEIISGEMERKEYKKGLATRAFAEANGDKELAKSLYIKFRYAELFSEMEVERKEKQRQQQMEDDRIESGRAETQWEQQIPTKDGMAFGICSKDWVVIGICVSFVALGGYIWITSKPESTPTTNTPHAVVTATEQPPAPVNTVPAQSAPQATARNTNNPFADLLPTEAQKTTQATAQDIFQRADNLYKQGQYAEALPLFQGLAEQGMPLALGVMYKYGEGVEQDFNQAVIWFGKAAKQGDARAQYELGIIYDNGNGVVKDYTQATYWYRKAAEQGNADAITALKKLEVNAPNSQQPNIQATPQDISQRADNLYNQGRYVEVLPLYQSLAEQGDAQAQTNLGFMYITGQGVALDNNQAVYWFSKAAGQGYASAQYNLGLSYHNGKGVTKDETKAVGWYRKAAEQGIALAQLNLGLSYHDGKGVTKDESQAVYWFRKAAEQGNANAIANLKKLGQ